MTCLKLRIVNIRNKSIPKLEKYEKLISTKPMNAGGFTYKCKYTVIGLFISGIVLVLTYLILSIKSINKKP